MEYIIVSLKHSTAKMPMYWRENNAGYTYSPFAAGKYSEEAVKGKPDYYNDGISTVAIPLTDQAMEKIGFKSSIDLKAVDEFYKKNPL